MVPKSILAAILVLALATMACGVTVNTPPLQELTTGATQTMDISVPAPSSGSTNLTLEFGAGELTLAPGAQNELVQGTATYNAEQLKPVITTNGSDVKVSTGNVVIRGIPAIRAKDFVNQWDLKLGNQPMALKINAGAYKGRMDLGGLALTSLEISDGAADVDLKFSQPNPGEMNQFVYTTGASNVNLHDLANANFSGMTFRSGAGSYSLDFSGGLKRDAAVTIESGVSQVTLVVPTGTSAQLSFKGGLSNVDMRGDWQKSGANYVMQGSGPTLTIVVTMGAGNLVLEN